MFKNEIIKNERRREIYSFIKANPGFHLRGLQRVLSIPLTSLEYHLSYMARKQIIFEEKNGNYMRYFCAPLVPEDKKVLLALRQNRLREIVLIVLSNKKAKYQFLVESLKLSHSATSLCLKHLVDENILERTKVGYENLYTIKDEDRVFKILTAYRLGFLDKLIDRTLNTWMETGLAKEKPE